MNKVEQLNRLLNITKSQLEETKGNSTKRFFDMLNGLDSTIEYNPLVEINPNIRTDYDNGNIKLRSFQIRSNDAVRYNNFYSPYIEVQFEDNLIDKMTPQNIYFKYNDMESDGVVLANYFLDLATKINRLVMNNRELFSKHLIDFFIKDHSATNPYNAKIRMVETFINFMNHIDKWMLENKIYEEKHIKFETSKYSPTFNGDLKEIDEFKYSRNPSGTYSAQLMYKGNVVSESSRCNENQLYQIINKLSQ
jgi:hypothetical protein